MEQTPNNLSIIENIILYPINELNNEIHYATINKHKERSIARVILTVLIATTLIFTTFYIPAINHFFLAILQAMGVSSGLYSLLFSGLTNLVAVYMGTYISKVIVNHVCKLLYGDQEFYLTKARAIELTHQLTEQFNTPIL